MQQPNIITPTTSAPPAATTRPWEDVLRDVQRAWSENYSPEDRVMPIAAPVPVPTPRQPGC